MLRCYRQKPSATADCTCVGIAAGEAGRIGALLQGSLGVCANKAGHIQEGAVSTGILRGQQGNTNGDHAQEILLSRLQSNLAQAGNLEDLMVLIEAGPLARWPAMALATAWHRLARHSRASGGGKRSERFADVVGRLSKAHSQADLSTFNARALANTLHAWAVLRLRDEGPLHKLCARLECALGECNGQELASILYSLGLLGARQMPLLKSACQLVPKRLGQFSAQDTSNMTYALALLRRRDTALLGILAGEVPGRLAEFTSQ
ncbi:unnamed protein product, partial [Polarella glacialis]